MNMALSNLLPIFIAFVLGLNLKRVYERVNMGLVDKISNICLYLLLVLMGVTIGLIPDIMQNLSKVGINALSIAAGSSLSIAIVLKVLHIKIRAIEDKGELEKGQATAFDIMGYITDPLVLAGLVVLGFFAGYRGVIPSINYEMTISFFLYLLIFTIAIKISYSGISLKEIFLNKQNLVMTFFTVIASYFGAAIVSLFIPLSLTQSLAVSSGFGWYTLSGIMFTKMGDPLLGSVAFLCDLFREAIAFLLIPTLSRIGNENIAIGVAGSTAMDVTLPVIEKHCGVSYVPVALLSGGIITIIVPFLIPFFYSL
ncbi:lysine exporter LysO family protein [Brenneria rubrifaciens]|uniref:Lysine exporter LysO family protein n=1 Tax=Brenneria rubrifaciens TaxID=55213 RepID=A0A4P8QWJ1_9GAMM|nr:lysine exporter LysO family protein [Brenneria rubrifaciens]QCR08585.1 lysine exporter LysO family protein [Brenneria rubrifaciens]